MVVACLAVFVALTGTSVAVVNTLPKNSVGTVQLKNDAGPKGDTGAAGANAANDGAVRSTMGSWTGPDETSTP